MRKYQLGGQIKTICLRVICMTQCTMRYMREQYLCILGDVLLQHTVNLMNYIYYSLHVLCVYEFISCAHVILKIKHSFITMCGKANKTLTFVFESEGVEVHVHASKPMCRQNLSQYQDVFEDGKFKQSSLFLFEIKYLIF